MTDASEPYQERNFRGRTLLGIGVAPIALVWLASLIGLNPGSAPKGVSLIIKIFLIAGILTYLIGYWQAVKSKGYHGMIWLAGLTGPIGLVVIFFLPDLNKLKRE